MEWSSLLAWSVGAAVLVVPAALILLVGAFVAVFPFAVLASALLRLDGPEPVAAEPVFAPERVRISKRLW